MMTTLELETGYDLWAESYDGERNFLIDLEELYAEPWMTGTIRQLSE